MGVGVRDVDSEGTETVQNKTRHSSYLETGAELWMSAEFTEAGRERERCRCEWEVLSDAGAFLRSVKEQNTLTHHPKGRPARLSQRN